MRKGERTRQRIIEKSSILFNQYGYADSSISDVMKVTGLEKGGIYRHFDSKEELEVNAFHYAIHLMGEHYSQALESEGNSLEKLTAFIDAFRTLFEDTPIPGGCPIMNAAIESDDKNPGFRHHVRMAMDGLLLTIQKIIMKGIQKKEINPSVDPQYVSSLFVSSLEGALMLSRLYQDASYLDQMINHLSAYIATYLKFSPAK
ncbi:TetR/AcrR family transcriptional regulator [Aneurinibacillus tyrosinisolvens]|uniref:TetR/AcrR family transcriptional regulator n=1 Tax=Aneurinibacillus tyrosinisolvens TaxID=1443435 RepID=UPI00063FC94B|nr:TetR/AcrR family transcriptional regulator [Aneurinibacillus tyrosinisolvens]